MFFQTIFFSLLCCFVGFLSACSKSSVHFLNQDGLQVSIINGQLVNAKDPVALSTVAVYDKVFGQLCTGVIIADDIVLTAAHCINEMPGAMSINFVTDFRGDVQASLTRPIEKLLAYEGWESRMNLEKNNGDIALLYFSGGLPEGFRVAQLLPNALAFHLKTGALVEVAGYGVTDARDDSTAGLLYKTALPIADFEFSDTEATLNQSTGTSVCHGDSGGPSFIKVQGQTFVWGLASRGVDDPDQTCKVFVTYTKVWMYQAWINLKITELRHAKFD